MNLNTPYTGPERRASPRFTSPRRQPPPAPQQASSRREARRDSRTLSRLLAAAEARERESIACRLHDEIGQLQVLERLKLKELRGLLDGPAGLLADELAGLMARTAAATRAVVFELAPPTWQGGLGPALQALAARVTSHGLLTVTHEGGLPALDLPEASLAVLCRVVQELCLNAQKHAGARRVCIRSSVEGAQLRLRVSDDGIGLPASLGSGFGLSSARAQLHAIGGALVLRSERGQGTCASILLPLPGGA